MQVLAESFSSIRLAFLLLDFFYLCTEIFNSSVSVHTFGNIIDIVSDNELQAVFIHLGFLCQSDERVADFVGNMIHIQRSHYLLESGIVHSIIHFGAVLSVIIVEKLLSVGIIPFFYQWTNSGMNWHTSVFACFGFHTTRHCTVFQVNVSGF